MRFAATHKAVSYLMVGTAFLLLALTGELPLLLTLITAVGLVGSYFFDPQTQPWMQRRAYAYVWYALLLVVLVVLVPDVGRRMNYASRERLIYSAQQPAREAAGKPGTALKPAVHPVGEKH